MRAALVAWGQPEVIGPLGGGHRNPVLELRRGRDRLVARWSRRSPASLDWEIGLLSHLTRHGLRVPAAGPALDGRRHVDGVLVQTWLDGTPPGPADWPAVTAAVRHLHKLTAHWPQRPGFASTQELRTTSQGGDVDLSAMPADAVAACRRAWAGLAGTPQAVVHGDLAPANIRISSAGPGLIDWDEARVDYTDLDLADLPGSLPPARLAAACLAVTAWEAANAWTTEPDYAERQLAALGVGRPPGVGCQSQLPAPSSPSSPDPGPHRSSP